MPEGPSFNPEESGPGEAKRKFEKALGKAVGEVESKTERNDAREAAELLKGDGVIVPDDIFQGKKGHETHFHEYMRLMDQLEEVVVVKGASDTLEAGERRQKKREEIMKRVNTLKELMRGGIFTKTE